ncbi:MAG: Xaa-Pro peptidase family protein [Elusimicrobiota bacterium]
MNIHAKRVADLQKLLRGKNLDGIIITQIKETYFLSGFHQDRTALLITPSKAFAFLPKMFLQHFRQTADFIEPIVYDNYHESIICAINEHGLKKVVFDPSGESYLEGKFWVSKGFREFSGLVSSLRLVKEGEELSHLKKACSIAAETFKQIKPKIKAGITEIEVAAEMEHMMRKKGAMEKSFDLIVAFGENSALPHHETSSRKLKKNEPVLLDFGCVYGRYCSDITRTFFYGNPSDEFLKIYSTVEMAQKAGVAAAVAGRKGSQVDAVCRDLISAAGYGQYFIHGTGHGVGLQIHEDPYLNTKGETVLKEGMTVTVEPGIYLYGKFGVRIEDTVLVGKKKSVPLTR